MTTKELLSDVLKGYLDETDTGPTRLANLSQVPRKTINHWLSGHVSRPRHWQDVVRVAQALHLTEAKADRLLLAAGHESVRKLLARAQDKDRDLLASLNGHHNQGDAVQAGATAPFRAPADLATFVGREEEIATLRMALLNEGQAVIYGVRGMGGVGKTALAIRLAYLLRGDFPDGVLWARLDVTDTLTVLASFADAFGKDVSQFRDVESRAAAVRGLLATKRALLVLDNAEDSTQVKPLLPPSDSRCAVLVTTRNDLDSTDGWPHLPLGGFAAKCDESLQLFAKLLGPERAARHAQVLTELAGLLGHLPLAVAIAGGQLSFAMRSAPHSQERPLIQDMLTDMRHESARLSRLQRDSSSVRASFNLSYDKLLPASQDQFAALGVFGGADFSVDAAAHVWDVTPAAAQTALRALVARSLVQPSREGRYRLHPLLQAYALEISANSDDLARARMVGYFADYVEANTSHERLAAEMDNILFALDEAQRLNLRRDLVRGLIGLGPYVNRQLPREVASRHLMRAIAASEELQWPIATARLLITLSFIERASRMFDRARAYLLQALRLLEEDQESPLWFDAYIELYALSADFEQYDEARSYVLQAMNVTQAHQNKRQTGMCLDRLGIIALRSSDFQDAYDLFSRALTLARETTDLNQIARLLTNLGDTAHCLEDFEGFARFSEEAVRTARETGHKRMLAMSLHNYSDALLCNGSLEPAMQHCMESLSLAKELDLPIILIHGYVLLGRLQHRQGSFEAAELTLQSALPLAQSLTHERHAEMRCLFGLGELYFEQGQYASATDAFTRLRKVAKDGTPDMKGLSEFGLARLACVEGRASDAAQLARQSFFILRSTQPKLATQVQQWAQEHLSIRLDQGHI